MSSSELSLSLSVRGWKNLTKIKKKNPGGRGQRAGRSVSLPSPNVYPCRALLRTFPYHRFRWCEPATLLRQLVAEGADVSNRSLAVHLAAAEPRGPQTRAPCLAERRGGLRERGHIGGAQAWRALLLPLPSLFCCQAQPPGLTRTRAERAQSTRSCPTRDVQVPPFLRSHRSGGMLQGGAALCSFPRTLH